MKLDIAGEKENPLLKRKELDVAIDHPEEATPSKAALQQLLAKSMSIGAEHIDVRQVFSSRGIAQSRASVFLWEEKKAEDLSKAKKKEEAPAAEEKGEGKAEAKEKPGEEKKEKAEKPAEKKRAEPGETKEEAAGEEKKA